MKYTHVLIFLFVFIYSWNIQSRNLQGPPGDNIMVDCIPDPDDQIGKYIVAMMEDSKGNLWFGTLSKGVAKYDGKSLQYLTKKDGLVSDAVVSIIEDKNGVIWFGTHEGISKLDGDEITNFTEEDGLIHFRVSDLFIDSKDIFWVGTWGGLCQFDGKNFIEFELPLPVVDVIPNPDTKDWITGISEDSRGNIWIGREGYGAYKYDGESIEHFTKKNGLTSNHIHAIVEDDRGNIWMGTRVAEKDDPDPTKRKGSGGLHKYDGKKVMTFSDLEGLHDDDVYEVYKDSRGDLWIGTLRNGAYKYDGVSFSTISFLNPLETRPVTRIMEDIKGNLWLGCAGGLYRINNDSIINVTTEGPWY